MSENDKENLRNAAEAQLADSSQDRAPMHPDTNLLHELQVHQIQLEMQNEALRHARNALEESRDRYVDLYEFAPVGYLTLSPEGLIAEINLTGADLLGKPRDKLLNRAFSALLIEGDQSRWVQSFMNMTAADAAAQQHRRLPLAFSLPDRRLLHVQADITVLKAADSQPLIRIALTDITEKKLIAAELESTAITLKHWCANAPPNWPSPRKPPKRPTSPRAAFWPI
jgi:PAS domain S-box-containing protein